VILFFDFLNSTKNKIGYKPTYLKDERGYMTSSKTSHLLTKVYTEVGMLGYAVCVREIERERE